MKRIIALIALTIIALLVVRDLTSAAGDAKSSLRQLNAIEMYDSRHGSMPEDKHDEYITMTIRVCEYLDVNPSLPDVWMLMTDNGMSSDAAATTIEAAITYMCTEHMPLLET